MGHDFIAYPEAQADNHVYSFTEAEKAEIERHAAKYPERRSAVMPALWIAQEKYGWLPQGAIQLVADTLGLSYAHVYGVATFYTMYLKESPGRHLLEICTCFTCGECGGRELFDYACKTLNVDDHGRSADGQFWVREAECLGACDTAPVAQLDNKRMRHNVDATKLDQIISQMRALSHNEHLSYEQVPLRDQSVYGPA